MPGFNLATTTPIPTPTVDPELVSPGPAGFIAIAILAVTVVLLIWDMQRRIRRVRYRAEVAEELDAEIAAAEAAEAAEAEAAAPSDAPEPASDDDKP